MGSSIDVIHISDNVSATFSKLKGSGFCAEINNIQASGMFLNGERFKVIPFNKAKEMTAGLRFKRVIWDTARMPSIKFMSEVESRACG